MAEYKYCEKCNSQTIGETCTYDVFFVCTCKEPIKNRDCCAGFYKHQVDEWCELTKEDIK